MSPMDVRHLAQENDYLVVEFPQYKAAMVFSVRAVMNKGREFFHYGSLPTTTTTAVTAYGGGGGTAVPADGTIAQDEFTTSGLYFPVKTTSASATFGMEQNLLDDNNNMWYLEPNNEHKNRIFQTLLKLTPSFLRLEIQVPNSVRTFNFQGDLPGGVDKPIGYMRGFANIAWLPGLRAGIRIGNDTNAQWRVAATFMFRELVVEVVRDPATIYQILTRTYPWPHLVKWVTMPTSITDEAIPNAIFNAYGMAGVAGFPFFGLSGEERDLALNRYRQLINQLKEGV